MSEKPIMGSPSDSDVPSDQQPISRRQLNQELHANSTQSRPIVSRGNAGQGAKKMAQDISRAQQYAPTKGRAFAAIAYERGAEGELFIAEALKWLPGDRFVVLHDQPWPGRPKANIDHIVIGPNGVFVVDAKNWSGKLTVTSDSLRQNGQDRTSTLVDCTAQASALTQLVRALPIPSVWGVSAKPILAFVSDTVQEQQALGVHIVRAKNLAAHIGPQPEIIAPEDVPAIASKLEEALRLDRQKSRALHAKNRSQYAARQQSRVQSSNAYQGPLKPQASTRPKTPNKRETRKRAKRRGELLRFAVVLAMLGVLALKPELVTSLAESAGTFFSDLVTGSPTSY